MKKSPSILNNLRIASPCSQDWNAMRGDNRKRYCGECKLNVYNISGMSRAEAENLLQKSGSRLCVRYFQRTDGTILTQDCPVGWQAVKKRAAQVATAAFTFLTALTGGLLSPQLSPFKPKQITGNVSLTPPGTPSAIFVLPKSTIEKVSSSQTSSWSMEAPKMGEVQIKGGIDTSRIKK